MTVEVESEVVSNKLETAIDRLFRNKCCLAPMVRANTLPLRKLCRQYGAHTLWTEELIDRKIIGTTRHVNDILGTIDYLDKDGRLVFQTEPQEKEILVLQMGSRNVEWALKAASMVVQDVSAIDLNMGCPKKFSIQDGMGAALLENKEKAGSIIKALRQEYPYLPITCKIRLLDTIDKTREFAQAMEEAGACAISIHMRGKKDSSNGPARWEDLASIVDAVQIPVIANGDLYNLHAVNTIRQISGCASVMLARPVLYNASIFGQICLGSSVLKPLDDVIVDYLRLCIEYDSLVPNTKYVIMEMMSKRRHPTHLSARLKIDLAPGKDIQALAKCKTMESICEIWGLDKELEVAQEERRRRKCGGEVTQANDDNDGLGLSKPPKEDSHKYSDDFFLKKASYTPENNLKRKFLTDGDDHEEAHTKKK